MLTMTELLIKIKYGYVYLLAYNHLEAFYFSSILKPVIFSIPQLLEFH